MTDAAPETYCPQCRKYVVPNAAWVRKFMSYVVEYHAAEVETLRRTLQERREEYAEDFQRAGLLPNDWDAERLGTPPAPEG